jgi:hypothetical protein
MSLKPDALCYVSAVDLAARIRARKVSPVEVIDTLTARIKRLNLGRYKWLTAAAARFYAEAFAAEPKRAEDPASANRSGATRAAALAGTGQGEDAGSLDAAERARLRQRALGWLRADLAAMGKRLETGGAEGRATVQARLRQWQRDPAGSSARRPG